MPSPLVSVVIPAFNRARCVAAAVASVQAQTYATWEVIVVDDGSSDGTSEVVQQLANGEPRLRLIRLDHNSGAQVARNAGIDAARGEWVAFLDSDDTWLPDSLATRLELALQSRVSVVHSTGQIRRDDGTLEHYPIPPTAGRVYEKLLLREGPLFPALLVRRSALHKIGKLNERIVAFQEWDTALALAKHYEFAFVPTPTFVWDCRGTDTMSRNFFKAGRGYEQVFRPRWFDILRVGGPGLLAEHYRRAAKWYQSADADLPLTRCLLAAFLWSSLDLRSTARRIRARLSRQAPFEAE